MKNSLEKYTYPFFETIRVANGETKLLEYHQRRVDHAFRFFYPDQRPIQLSEHIPEGVTSEAQPIKLRIAYNATECVMETTKYVMRPISKLLPKETNFNYPFKFSDRHTINELRSGLLEDEELLLLTGDRVRECSYANLLFYIDDAWLTPMYPMFYGVMRTHLLSIDKIQEADLCMSDLQDCTAIKLINAMMPMEACITLARDAIWGLV